jgi:C1A family cysteine protease
MRFKSGWKPDIPDHRDVYRIHKPQINPLTGDLRKTGFLPSIWNQGELGSCVAHSTLAAYVYCLGLQGILEFMPSRLMAYYNARVKENSVNEDNGCQIRTAVKELNNLGVCHEDLWPYKIRKFSKKPDDNCYYQANKEKVLQYSRVGQTENEIESCITNGYPVCVGITLYDSFESDEVAKNGIISLPGLKENCIGGHAVLIVGYDHVKRMFILRNSWDVDWGEVGYFYVPYDYILNANLADDFWILQMIEDEAA